MKTKKKSGLLITGIIMLVLAVLFNVITPMYESSLRVALRVTHVDEAQHTDALENGYALNRELMAEGAVLLRNENNVLPVDTKGQKVKVNVFGVRSAHLVLNSAGSASGSNAEAATLKDGLEAGGFEVNPALWSLLEGVSVKDKTAVNEGGSSEAVNELSPEEYTGEASFENAKAYSDYAIVTFSRLGGEGADQTRSGMGENQDQSYLELTVNEKALLRELKACGFKVIVLINSSYAMELGPLEEFETDAALWIGGPGVKGALAIGKLLSGEINPSGRLADTYAYDLTTSSTYITSDNYKVVDASGNEIGGYTDYSEAIYVGYRWYETADAEGFWNSSFANGKWGVSGYGEVVQYPFGYGLSYTSFTQSFAKTPVYTDGTFDFEVEVTNTGAAAGKEVVQLYVETPYIQGGTEKSKVVLCAFGKTQELAPGKSEKVRLTVKAEDIASYSMTAVDGAGAYMLDPGEYRFYLASGETGAHCWADPADSFEASLGETVYTGDNKRSSDVTAASNLLQDGDVRDGSRIDLLSRSNQFENAEQAVFSPRENYVTAEGNPLYEQLVNLFSKAGTYKGDVLSDLRMGESGTLTFAEMAGAAYDDPRWEELIAQMSLDDLIKLTGTGGWSTAEIASISKPATTDIDGPFGLSNLIKNNMGTDVKCVSYATEVVMASTWNQDLIERIGKAVAEEAIVTNTSGWYAPGANLHRTPFGGRNPEYYSEDPLLSGMMCAAEVSGAQSRGLYTYVKHFAFNEVEANRTGMENCYVDEQTARELYLRPFEIAVKNSSFDSNGKQTAYPATGLMSSYMWYGENWGGNNYALMTRLLRGEWGFNGMVITDNAAVAPKWITLAKAIYGGTDLMLVYNTAKLPKSVSESDEGVSALKTAAKHILWTIADASPRREAQAEEGFDGWKAVQIGANVLLLGGAAACLVLYFIRNMKRRKA